MREVVVSVEELGKKFLIGHQKSGDLRQAFGQTFRRFLQKNRSRVEEFWALKDINFEIRRGEVVGIIGRNGAGKSTLLKILSRITSPTTGRFVIDGRVSSLLEVGTGFHSELTGRENIFLNGTILGMRRAEIKAKFDEIVAFSGVENFIDTPVKHYSSGMKVRLAFSVAAHLEPEILIVDEVLAVGDAEFQKKCLGKMDEVSKKEGRTILFVSHNLGAVQTLCNRGIVLGGGRIITDDTVQNALRQYLAMVGESDLKALQDSTDRSGTQDVVFQDVYLENNHAERIDNVMAGSSMSIVTTIKVNKVAEKVNVGFSFHDGYDSVNTVIYSGFQNQYFNFSEGIHKVVFCMKEVYLAAGPWTIKGLIKVNGEISDWPRFSLGKVFVEVGNYYGSNHPGDRSNDVKFLVKGDWSAYEDNS